MKKFTTKLKAQIEENPGAAIVVTVVAVTALTKLMNANTAHQNSKTWKREVERRSMNTK